MSDWPGAVVKAWLKGTATQREALRAQWPTLADALDALAWRPGQEGTAERLAPTQVDE